MPIGLSAKKSLRKSLRNNKANKSLKLKVKTASKAFLEKPSADGLKAVYSIVDKAVKNHIIHAHKAARLKAHYSKKVGKEVKAVVKKKAAKSQAKMS